MTLHMWKLKNMKIYQKKKLRLAIECAKEILKSLYQQGFIVKKTKILKESMSGDFPELSSCLFL